MYTPANLSEDIKNLNSINNELKKNLAIVDEQVKAESIDDNYVNCLDASYDLLERYANISKNMNLQEIYSNTDTYSEELLATFKKVTNANYQLKEIFTNFFDNRDRFVKVYLLMMDSFGVLEYYVQLEYEEKQKMYKTISSFFLKNRIKPFEKDEDFAYVDDFCEVLESIGDNSISNYLNSVYEAIDKEEMEESSEEDSSANHPERFAELGYEDYNVVEKKEDDYEDIGDILKKMQRDNRRNGGF